METTVESSAIQVTDLHVSYRTKGGQTLKAVQGLSFAVQPGEVVGFLGPNGAGKSSTIKALMGFVEPDSGSASIMGLRAGSLAARKRVGYLPEVALYYPYLTPIETLTLFGELQGLRGPELRKEAMHLLELVGLSESYRRQNRTLSKGMLQRVGIAQSLLGSPDVLILDEVTSGLDPIGRRELRNLLKARRDAGCTLFFSSHELAEVEMLCDRLLLIDKGHLIEERKLEDLRDQLREFEVTYTGGPVLSDWSEDIEIGEGGAVRVRFSNQSDLLQAIDRIHQQGGKVIEMIAREGSLEDYFIDTIQRAA